MRRSKLNKTLERKKEHRKSFRYSKALNTAKEINFTEC